MAKPKSILLPLPPQVVERFWANVERRSADECWPWIGRRNRDGYGLLGMRRTTFRSPRLAMAVQGIDPGEFVVCHRCDNPSCCNPRHIYLGTQADNMRDAIERDRISRGSRHAMAKVSDEQVLIIRDQYVAGMTVAALAAMHGVSVGLIQGVVEHRKWKHLGGPRRTVARGGEYAGAAKLTWPQVREIRALVAGGVGRAEAARRFGVSGSVVSRIVAGKSWKEGADV